MYGLMHPLVIYLIQQIIPMIGKNGGNNLIKYDRSHINNNNNNNCCCVLRWNCFNLWPKIMFHCILLSFLCVAWIHKIIIQWPIIYSKNNCSNIFSFRLFELWRCKILQESRYWCVWWSCTRYRNPIGYLAILSSLYFDQKHKYIDKIQITWYYGSCYCLL